MADGVVDWELGGRIARAVAGDDATSSAGADADSVGATCEAALVRVLDYTGLEPVTEVPGVETITRTEWIAANLAELSELVAPLEARAAAEISIPRPLDGLVRGGLGAAGGVEAGVVVGYASRRVLGQYQVSLTPVVKPPRMLIVGRNLAGVAGELGVDEGRFLLWVAIHEQTHSVQFAAVPWLHEHVAGLVGRLIETASGSVDVSALLTLARRLVTTDPRRALREALRGGLARAVAGPEQAAILDQLQATMAVIEGYAEHVMDAAASDDDDLEGLRVRMDARRRRRSGFGDVIALALGLGMKLRQYELGKAWSDAVAATAGIEGLNTVWREPAALPSLAELERPADWLARVSAAAVR